MVVEVGEIDIKGNVGSNAKVCAKRVNIEGQTHKTSQIKADDITINIHKGSAVGHNIKVSRLDTVNGDPATVDLISMAPLLFTTLTL